MLNTIRVCFTW